MNFEYPIYEFEQRYKHEHNARAKIRLQILLLRKKKYMQQDIAAYTNVTQGTVSNVCKRFLREGWNSVYDKPRSGAPARIVPAQKKRLHKAMQDVVPGTTRGWQTKDVCSYLKKHFHIDYTPRHARRIMHTIGMSWKVPRPQHKKHDPAAVQEFKKKSSWSSFRWQMSTKSSALTKHTSGVTQTKGVAGLKSEQRQSST